MKPGKFIYTLAHPDTGVVFYVGSTQDLKSRVNHHYNNPHDSLRSIIDSLKSKGKRPVIEEVEAVSGEFVSQSEFFWISMFLSWGFPLANVHRKGGRKYYTSISSASTRYKEISHRAIKQLGDRITLSDALELQEKCGITINRLFQIINESSITRIEYKMILRFYYQKRKSK